MSMQLPEVNGRNKTIIAAVAIAGVVALGIFISWFNTGDVFTGLHNYGMAIVVMVIGTILIFINRDTLKTIGILMFASGLIYLFIGVPI